MRTIATAAVLAVLAVLAGTTAGCTSQPDHHTLPQTTSLPSAVDTPGDAAVRSLCDRVIDAAHQLLGDEGRVSTPYAVHQPTQPIEGGARLTCQSYLTLCRHVPTRPIGRLQELDVTVLDPRGRPGPSPLPSGVAAAQVDGVPVYVHDPYTGPGDQSGAWFSLDIHNQRVEVGILFFDTVSEAVNTLPNQQTLDACNAAWDKAWPKMAQSIITALR